jgi:phage-related protein
LGIDDGHPILGHLYPFQYTSDMKPISFLGNSLERLREFPDDARQDAGYALDQLQRGLQPSGFGTTLARTA